MTSKMTLEQAWRVAHAKAGEYEAMFKQRIDAGIPQDEAVTYLMADLALMYSLFADHIESEMVDHPE